MTAEHGESDKPARRNRVGKPPGLPSGTDSGPQGARHARFQFTFTCQRCGSALSGTSDVAGQRGRCPTCGAVFWIPEVDPRTGNPIGPAMVADDGELRTPIHAYAAAGAKAPRIVQRKDGTASIACPRCEAESAIEANNCTRCGLPFTIDGALVEAPRGLWVLVGITSIGLALLGLAAAIISRMPIPSFAAIGLGLFGVLLASEEKRSAGRAESTIGILLGLIGVVVALLQ